MVERIIGVFKKRFKIVREDNYYPMATQVKLIPALCALHNFIRLQDPADEMEITQEELDEMLEEERATRGNEGASQGGSAAAESDRASQRRDDIAHAIWIQYCEYSERRRSRRR